MDSPSRKRKFSEYAEMKTGGRGDGGRPYASSYQGRCNEIDCKVVPRAQDLCQSRGTCNDEKAGV